MATVSDGKSSYYLFCFARSGLVPEVEGTGVDGESPVFLWSCMDVAAVLSGASIGDFCGPAAETRMQDLSWLGPRACRHEEVIERAASHSPVLPAPFGTLFASLDSLEMLVNENHRAISGFLDHVEDSEEWAVKGLLDREGARKALLSICLAEQEEQIDSSSPGMRYLLQQRIRAEVDRKLNHWLGETCQRIAAGLRSHASDFRERKVISNFVAEKTGDVILNWAFLLPRSGVADFHSRIARVNADHAQQGLSLEVSGPWPPYSFSPPLLREPEP